MRKEGLRDFSLPKIEVELGKELLNYKGIRIRESEILCLVGRNGVGKTKELSW